MKNVQAIIDLFGGLASFRHVRLECKGYMPLVIEAIGPGPRGLPMVSVCHSSTQNGDAIRHLRRRETVIPDFSTLPHRA